jgi:glycosyltransferase involved in cell wall biosynthesis
LANELSKLNDIEVGIVAAINLNVPDWLNFKRVENLVEAIEYAEQIYAILVFRPTINLDKTLTQKLFSSNAELIAWAHVNPSQKTLRVLARARSVKKIVALGGRQYMTWIDNPVARKAIVIKNGQYLPESRIIKYSEPKYVTYLGSIVPQKGFHLLAKIWPEVHKQNPGLRLKVIGSGSLYDPNAQMGKFGIADEQYENLFLTYLGDSLSSVDFLGKISAEEKNLVISNSYVGIANPSGNTENCPASALDFEAFSVPVLSVYKFGLIDTVIHMKTGMLVKNYSEISNALNIFMEDSNFRDKLASGCREFLVKEFNFETITQKWGEILSSDFSEQVAQQMEVEDLVNTREKIAFWYAKLTQSRFTMSKLPSSYEIEFYLKKIAKLVFRNRIIKNFI